MEVLNTLIVALLASTAVGMAVSLIIQIGKLFLPKWFPDGSADNWRLGLVVLTAVVVTALGVLGYPVEVGDIESVAVDLSALGTTLMPLFVLLTNWIAKQTYANVLKGVSRIGKSYSP
jgi:hypothetical protein